MLASPGLAVKTLRRLGWPPRWIGPLRLSGELRLVGERFAAADLEALGERRELAQRWRSRRR